VVILGGGLAGLTASMYSGAPVYEAEGAGGGVAASDSIAGFVFDRGIHVLQTKNQVVLDLLAELGLKFTNHRRKAYIYSHKRYAAYPFQVNTVGLPIGLRFRCVWQFLRRQRHPNPTNYQEWMYRSVGTEFAQTFLIPYSEKFWTVHPRDMTWEWTGGRVPQPTVGQVLRGALWAKQTALGTNVDFRYPQGGGYGTIAKALLRRAGPVHLGYRATCLDTANRRVTFSNGASVPYDLLINTIPLPELIRICPDAPEGVRAASARLRTNSIRVVNLGINRPNLSDRHWVHFPEKDISFFRISYPSNFGPELAPKGTSSISAELAYSPSRPLAAENIVDRVVDDLIRVGALGKNDAVILKTSRDIKYAYCIYDKHRKESLRTVYSWLKSVGVIPCGRYGLWTYFWSDEAVLSGKRAAEIAAGTECGYSFSSKLS
jgi:protoporphyrinogen oxidase